MKNIIIGTAGHVDHGKSTLIEALTGTNPDRLQEEKDRGITIDIGFASLDLDENSHIGFIDVPGHKRFVKNMLVGVGGIDAILLVVAADESVMPQTREHVDICRMLEIPRGIVAVTKSDLVAPELLELVCSELREYLKGTFLADSPIVPVSSVTGEGLDSLTTCLVELVRATPGKDSRTICRLPVDRCFTLKGFGTVVTGTLISGTVGKEEELEIYPVGKITRIRNIQVHGAYVERAMAGQRVALNLQNVDVTEVRRGMQLSWPRRFSCTSTLDAIVQLLEGAPISLKSRTPVRFHHGTSELQAVLKPLGLTEIGPGQHGLARISLEHPVLALPGDRFVMRRVSPIMTIGGGQVLDNHPARTRGRVGVGGPTTFQLPTSLQDMILDLARREGSKGVNEASVLGRTLAHSEDVKQAFHQVIGQGSLFLLNQSPLQAISVEAHEQLCQQVLKVIEDYHAREPLSPGISKEQLSYEVFRDASVGASKASLDRLLAQGKIVMDREHVRLQTHRILLNLQEAESQRRIEEAFVQAGWKVPLLDDVLTGLGIPREQALKLVQLLTREKKLIRISESLFFHADSINRLRQLLVEYKRQSHEIDVGQFKVLTDISRKYAIPLLEYFDRERITRRVGNHRLIL